MNSSRARSWQSEMSRDRVMVKSIGRPHGQLRSISTFHRYCLLSLVFIALFFLTANRGYLPPDYDQSPGQVSPQMINSVGLERKRHSNKPSHRRSPHRHQSYMNQIHSELIESVKQLPVARSGPPAQSGAAPAGQMPPSSTTNQSHFDSFDDLQRMVRMVAEQSGNNVSHRKPSPLLSIMNNIDLR